MAMMCESHAGAYWPHGECLGPGMPWPCNGGMFGSHPEHYCEACYVALNKEGGSHEAQDHRP